MNTNPACTNDCNPNSASSRVSQLEDNATLCQQVSTFFVYRYQMEVNRSKISRDYGTLFAKEREMATTYTKSKPSNLEVVFGLFKPLLWCRENLERAEDFGYSRQFTPAVVPGSGSLRFGRCRRGLALRWIDRKPNHYAFRICW